MTRNDCLQNEWKSPQEVISQLIDSCSDIKAIIIPSGEGKHVSSVHLVYCEGLCDGTKVEQCIISQLKKISEQVFIETDIQLQQHVPFHMNTLQIDQFEKSIVDTVLNGDLLLLFVPSNKLYSVKLSNPPKRQPEEPNTEISVRGPKDGFTEESLINIALIRKRLKTKFLAVEDYTIGEQTATKVNLLYLKNIIEPAVLQEVKTKLSNLQVEGLVSSSQLEESLAGFSLFPLFSYTGRPDFAVNCLLHGKFVLIVDGSPTVIMAPVNFNFLLNTSEDAFMVNVFVSFTRLLRISGVVISLFLPGFWVALVTFHQDQLPFTLLATVVTSRQGVPLSVPIEAITMLFLFEIFREAGMRLPTAFGQTLSVVGGLIIGQAAVSAGIATPGIIVINAISVLANFTLVNHSLITIVSLMRIVVLFISGSFGLYGMLICLLVFILYFVNLRSFSMYYMTPFSPFDFQRIYKMLFRMPWGRIK
ncbi:spore germination protein [Neobacillus massiliamazoniensis]|uniref:Spore germination protein GerXA n=1 Tax=Neobacillus massiliamazoniensis TaxID=1499688 RepID=A0A0U1P463_9BACI|nr:spore germination protein [Neobacillus massiliamazoniensis]CRK84981.1 spore germination protein GerXA [Neobacillus massiliamazoniensis]